MRARRSALFMPGSNARAQQKARGLPLDTVILDLEDAVAPESKDHARQQVLDTLAEGGFGRREIAVRVNGLDTPWGRDDVAAIAGSGADAVVFPKIESADAVLAAIAALDAAGGASDLPLWIMIETPAGVMNVSDILVAHARVELVIMGTSDLAKELRVRHTPGREGLLWALGQCVMAARLYGLDILDGVHLDLEDMDSFSAICQQGRNMGFDGKTLIHPKQIETANQVFGISEQELGHARNIIWAWEQAQAEGAGVCLVEGRLVENLHVDEARRVIAIAETME